MVEKVEDTAADTSGDTFPVEGQKNTTSDLNIEGRECRETIYVSRPHVGSVHILDGVRKSGMNVVDRNHREFPRCGKRTPNQEAIWRVKRQTALCVWLYDWLGQVPEELIDVIEIPVGARADVRRVQHALTKLVTRCHLELTIGIGSSVRKREHPGRSSRNGLNDQVVAGPALFVGHSQEEARKKLAIEFQTPGGAARVVQTAVDYILVRHRARWFA